MFDKTIVNQKVKEYVPYVKTEVKAPTDDSVKLLNEMQVKARENIIDSISLRNSSFDAVFTVFEDVRSYSKVVSYKYILNCKTFRGEIKFDSSETHSRQSIIELVCDKIKNSIFGEITGPLAQAVFDGGLPNKRY